MQYKTILMFNFFVYYNITLHSNLVQINDFGNRHNITLRCVFVPRV